MKKKFCFSALCALILTLIFISDTKADVFKHFSRFSDVLRKGSQWNSESLGRYSPAYYDTSRVVDDNEAAETSAGTIQTVATGTQPQSHISSGFSPVTFTSRVQLPQFNKADAPNKEDSYSRFPVQSNRPQQPLHPVLHLQPIIQYIIQLPSQKQFGQSGNELEKLVDLEQESSTSNLSENLIEMMEEASKGEDADSGSPMPETSTTEKIQHETMDNLMSIIEHMNNVSDADVRVNSPQLSTDSANSSAENDIMLMYGAPESERSSSNYQYVDPYGGYSSAQESIDNSQSSSVNSPQEYYNSPNRNIIRDGFLKSNLRSLQPGPVETEQAISLFSHLSDQIFRDLNKETRRNDVSYRNADGRPNPRGGRYGSSVMGNNPPYSAREKQESIILDPNYGESSAYYTSYSNQRPPLDSEIYQTLQSILSNK